MPFLTGGSCRATIIGEEGRRDKLFMSERNTSQLPRLLCCTMVRERETLPDGGGVDEESVSSISGSSLDHQVGRERDWGPPGGAGPQPLE